jgi:hypothetical protein
MAALQAVLLPVSIASLVIAHAVAHRRQVRGPRSRLGLWLATLVAVALWTVQWLVG